MGGDENDDRRAVEGYVPVMDKMASGHPKPFPRAKAPEGKTLEPRILMPAQKPRNATVAQIRRAVRKVFEDKRAGLDH